MFAYKLTIPEHFPISLPLINKNMFLCSNALCWWVLSECSIKAIIKINLCFNIQNAVYILSCYNPNNSCYYHRITKGGRGLRKLAWLRHDKGNTCTGMWGPPLLPCCITATLLSHCSTSFLNISVYKKHLGDSWGLRRLNKLISKCKKERNQENQNKTLKQTVEGKMSECIRLCDSVNKLVLVFWSLLTLLFVLSSLFIPVHQLLGCSYWQSSANNPNHTLEFAFNKFYCNRILH